MMWLIATILVARPSMILGCGGILALSIFSPSAEFTTPNYPRPHNAKENCVWVVAAPQVATRLTLNCDIHTYTNDQGGCENVYLNFTNGEEEKSACGIQSFSEIIFGVTSYVKFLSKLDDNTQYNGISCIVSYDPDHIPNKTPPLKPNYRCGEIGGERIIGGTETIPHKYPWLALIKKPAFEGFLCAATLIALEWVLSASHCIEELVPSTLSILFGLHHHGHPNPKSQEVPVKNIIRHENYNRENKKNDIALIHLAKPVAFNDIIYPVCLPFIYKFDDIANKKGTIAGWGYTVQGNEDSVSNFPKEIEQSLLNAPQCKSSNRLIEISEDMICGVAPNEAACNGDDGGPLVWRSESSKLYFQLGVMSSVGQCGRQNEPTIYANVPHFLDWIVENTNAAEEFCVKE